MLMVLTYSEGQRFSCITNYAAVPDGSTFPDAVTINPAESESYGLPLRRSVKAIAILRDMHVYPVEYLKSLHWRFQPKFPLSAEQAARRSPTRYSLSENSSTRANIEIDFGRVRATVAHFHDQINILLWMLMSAFLVSLVILNARMILLYVGFRQYCGMYHFHLRRRTFLRDSLSATAELARTSYIQEQRTSEEQSRRLNALRREQDELQEKLRSAQQSLSDDVLRMKISDALQTQPPSLEVMRRLWLELQEKSGLKTPGQKLELLLETLKPYCVGGEFEKYKAEVMAMLSRSRFKDARKLVVTIHDQLRVRARELEEMEKSDVAVDQ